jgi:predicted transposase/invertase (TIGR01784 family)
MARLIADQIRKGDQYEGLRQVIMVIICDHIILEEAGRYLNTFFLRTEGSEIRFTDLVKIITIELPKVPRERDGDAAWPWARFFICRSEKEFDMLAKEHPEVGKAVGTLKKMSLGEQLRELMFQETVRTADRLARESYVREVQEKSREKGLQEGKEEGRKEGKEEGREEGRRVEREKAFREKLEAARKLKAEGLSADRIADILELPRERAEEA